MSQRLPDRGVLWKKAANSGPFEDDQVLELELIIPPGLDAGKVTLRMSHEGCQSVEAESNLVEEPRIVSCAVPVRA